MAWLGFYIFTFDAFNINFILKCEVWTRMPFSSGYLVHLKCCLCRVHELCVSPPSVPLVSVGLYVMVLHCFKFCSHIMYFNI